MPRFRAGPRMSPAALRLEAASLVTGQVKPAAAARIISISGDAYPGSDGAHA